MIVFVGQAGGEALIMSPMDFVGVEDANGELMQHPPGSVSTYSPEELLEKGIVAIEVVTPEGERLVSMAAVLVAGVPDLETVFEPIPPPAVPPEVAMHRAHKAMMLTPWPDGRNFGGEDLDLYDAALLAMATLPAPSNKLARAEFTSAPNIVRDGATTAAVAGLLGMTAEEVDDLFLLAQTLP